MENSVVKTFAVFVPFVFMVVVGVLFFSASFMWNSATGATIAAAAAGVAAILVYLFCPKFENESTARPSTIFGIQTYVFFVTVSVFFSSVTIASFQWAGWGVGLFVLALSLVGMGGWTIYADERLSDSSIDINLPSSLGVTAVIAGFTLFFYEQRAGGIAAYTILVVAQLRAAIDYFSFSIRLRTPSKRK